MRRAIFGVMVGLGVVVLSASPACGVFNSCDFGDPKVCESATSYSRCIGGEGQYHRYTEQCPPDQTCDTSRPPTKSEAPCFGKPAGGSCTDTSSCDYGLRCENAVCTAPPAAATAACTSAMVVTVANVGEPLEVDLPLSSDVAPFETTLGTSCDFDRIGLLRVARAPAATVPLNYVSLSPVDKTTTPSVRTVVPLVCANLFASENRCTSMPQPTEFKLFYGDTFLVSVSADVIAPTLRLRLLTR